MAIESVLITESLLSDIRNLLNNPRIRRINKFDILITMTPENVSLINQSAPSFEFNRPIGAHIFYQDSISGRFYIYNDKEKFLNERTFVNPVIEELEEREPEKPACLTSFQITVIDEVEAEIVSATAAWPPFNSAHEAYGILAEEFIELQAHVFTNQKRRDLAAMRKEAIQVAAMAIRFAAEVCDEERGRK